MKFYCSVCRKELLRRETQERENMTIRSYWHIDDGSSICAYAEIIKQATSEGGNTNETISGQCESSRD